MLFLFIMFHLSFFQIYFHSYLAYLISDIVTSGSDPRRTHNADSDGRPKWGRTSEDESERRGIEAGVRLDVDKHAGGP
jgi:hypothetical protein